MSFEISIVGDVVDIETTTDESATTPNTRVKTCKQHFRSIELYEPVGGQPLIKLSFASCVVAIFANKVTKITVGTEETQRLSPEEPIPAETIFTVLYSGLIPS